MRIEEIDAYVDARQAMDPPPPPTDEQIVKIRRLFGVDEPRRPRSTKRQD